MVGSLKRARERVAAWEFRPGYILDIPVYFMRAYFSLKARNPLFFSNVNPGIIFSGFVEASKYDTLLHFDSNIVPKTFLFHAGDPIHSFATNMQKHDLSYPIIAKPNSSGRNGKHVCKITNEQDFIAYTKSYSKDILVQESIDYPFEFGVFYYRIPGEEKGYVTGMVSKEFLFVEGNGTLTLEALVSQHPRASHYKEFFHSLHQKQRSIIIPKGETIQLSYIGNHCKGSVFYDASHLVTPELVTLFDTISKQYPGFYLGRYDLKAKSINDLYAGNFKILELNGVISEPTRIYDPNNALWNAYKTTFKHWKYMFQVSQANSKKGHKPLTFKEARTLIKKYGV